MERRRLLQKLVRTRLRIEDCEARREIQKDVVTTLERADLSTDEATRILEGYEKQLRADFAELENLLKQLEITA